MVDLNWHTRIARQLVRDRAAVLILFVFLLIYVSISWVNHWLLRTYALDLGLYSNTVWKYAHGILPDRSLFTWNEDPILADHFDLQLILWAPLMYIFGEWTLLVVQVVAVLFGGLGVYRLSMAFKDDRLIASLLMLCCLGFFGVFTALAFDFHSNVVAAMALPWYFIALHRRQRMSAWGLFIFMLIAKENMGLWLCIVAVAIMGVEWVDRRMTKVLALQAVCALSWSVVVIAWLMPGMDSGQVNFQSLKYAHLGSGWTSIVENLLTRPMDVLRYFVIPMEDPKNLGNALKLEFYMVLLFSGGWALLLRWRFLLMAMPLLAQKMLSGTSAMSGLFAHYSVEFAVLLPLAMMDLVVRVGPGKWRHAVVVLGLSGVVGGTIYTLDLPLEHADNDHGAHDQLRFYQARHYRSNLDVAQVYKTLEMIPPDASVSAVSRLVPHLIGRRFLYAFPIVHDPDYVVFIKDDVPWPLTPEEFVQSLEEYRSSRDWEQLADTAGLLIFHRVSMPRP